MTAEHRESMLIAVESARGLDRLRALVQQYLNDGVAADLLLEDLTQISALVPEDTAELVMEVMDLLTGWCAPEFRLVPQPKNESGSAPE